MEINWFTFFAQIVNFIILVLLLRRFLYGPITQTMLDRQARIDERWKEAERQKVEAQQQSERYRQQQQMWEQQQERLMSEAKVAAEEVRADLLRQVRLDVDRLQAGWQQSVDREREEFLVTLKQRIASEAWEIARRVLQDLASVDIERRVVAIFLDRLKTLDERERARLRESVRESGRNLTIRSSFELSPQTRQTLLDILRQQQMLGDGGAQFSTSPESIAGIELQAGDRAIAWSVDSYLETLADRFSAALSSHRGVVDIG